MRAPRFLDSRVYSSSEVETRGGNLRSGFAARPTGGYGRVAIVQGNIPNYVAETRGGNTRPGFTPATGGQFVRTRQPMPSAPAPAPTTAATPAQTATRASPVIGPAYIDQAEFFKYYLANGAPGRRGP